MSFEIRFLGAAGTVTGSKYLISDQDNNVLVDCGLFQGLKSLRLQNWEGLPVKATEIDAIILTHAHLDHSGYIPRLIKEGFEGKIYCTPATKELCHILLLDAGHLMEEEAEYLNRHKKTKHDPALPLFTKHEAEQAMAYFETVSFGEKKKIGSAFEFYFAYVGHILGAASVILTVNNKKVAFTGDIGRMKDKIFYPPAPLPDLDYLITESTYGNRLHPLIYTADELAKAIQDTLQKKGVLLIPAFAVGRVQSLLYDLSILIKQKRIPEFPMFLNSPMAMDVSEIFWNNKSLHRLTNLECKESCDVVHYVKDVEESKALNQKKGPLLIIAGSGMLTGGRILHHLKAFASDPNNMILLTGFQAAGTRGESLANGAPEIKIHGNYLKVKAQVRILNNMSAHADYNEMMEWFESSKIKPLKVFITHGEPSASDELRRRLAEKFNWNCYVPARNEIIKLD